MKVAKDLSKNNHHHPPFLIFLSFKLETGFSCARSWEPPLGSSCTSSAVHQCPEGTSPWLPVLTRHPVLCLHHIHLFFLPQPLPPPISSQHALYSYSSVRWHLKPRHKKNSAENLTTEMSVRGYSSIGSSLVTRKFQLPETCLEGRCSHGITLLAQGYFKRMEKIWGDDSQSRNLLFIL